MQAYAASYLQASVHAQHVLQLAQFEGDRHHGVVILVPGQSEEWPKPSNTENQLLLTV